MSKTIYMIPTVYTSGNVPMRYRIECRKRDMRSSFCKKHEQHIVDADKLLSALGSFDGVRIKGTDILIPSGATARRFMLTMLRKGVQ